MVRFCTTCNRPHKNGLSDYCNEHLAQRQEIDASKIAHRDARFQSFMELPEEERWRALWETLLFPSKP